MENLPASVLRRAALATLAVFNPSQVYAAHGEQPGADLARYLARHGVQLEVVVRETGGDVGESFLFPNAAPMNPRIKEMYDRIHRGEHEPERQATRRRDWPRAESGSCP